MLFPAIPLKSKEPTKIGDPGFGARVNDLQCASPFAHSSILKPSGRVNNLNNSSVVWFELNVAEATPTKTAATNKKMQKVIIFVLQFFGTFSEGNFEKVNRRYYQQISAPAHFPRTSFQRLFRSKLMHICLKVPLLAYCIFRFQCFFSRYKS